ncbi:hypothetical protein SB659_17550 [Arthrobacter sp. SIMBA_036]|uniref:hypothetical protein n=1 Tax=Arthrobacter sp. SIMBA_036 TaxID=3085778 RepID=UPI00397D08CB
MVGVLVNAAIGTTSPTLDDIRLHEEVRHYGARNPKVTEVLQCVEDDSLEILHRGRRTRTARTVNVLLWGWWSHRLAHGDSAFNDLTLR